MAILINLDAERAKRGKLRGMTQAEKAMFQHDGYLAPSSMAGRQAAFDERAQAAANELRHIAEHGDYNV